MLFLCTFLGFGCFWLGSKAVLKRPPKEVFWFLKAVLKSPKGSSKSSQKDFQNYKKSEQKFWAVLKDPTGKYPITLLFVPPHYVRRNLAWRQAHAARPACVLSNKSLFCFVWRVGNSFWRKGQQGKVIWQWPPWCVPGRHTKVAMWKVLKDLTRLNF